MVPAQDEADNIDEIQLRWYQDEAVEATMRYLDEEDGHPIIVVPTGAGKTLIICELINEFLTSYTDSSILVLSHVKEITPEVLQQAQLIKDTKRFVKILGNSGAALSMKAVFKADKFSVNAQQLIEKAGGTAQVLKRQNNR